MQSVSSPDDAVLFVFWFVIICWIALAIGGAIIKWICGGTC